MAEKGRTGEVEKKSCDKANVYINQLFPISEVKEKWFWTTNMRNCNLVNWIGNSGKKFQFWWGFKWKRKWKKKSPPPSPYIISNVICVIKKSLFFPITRSNLETLWFFPSLDGGEKGLKQAFGLGEKVLAVTSSIGNMEWNDDKSVFAKICNLY